MKGRSKKSRAEDDEYRPSAPMATGTFPRHGNRPPKVNFHGKCYYFNSFNIHVHN